jgi:hypothetical protein
MGAERGGKESGEKRKETRVRILYTKYYYYIY